MPTKARHVDQLSHRVPPRSIEAEESVLGGLLLDGGAMDAVADVLTTADFYVAEHAQIYGAMLELHEQLGRSGDPFASTGGGSSTVSVVEGK